MKIIAFSYLEMFVKMSRMIGVGIKKKARITLS